MVSLEDIQKTIKWLRDTTNENVIYIDKDLKRELGNVINDLLELNKIYKARIDKANKILGNILVIKRSDGNYGAVKNTTKEEVYKTICMLNEILETPHRVNYNLLGDKENE